MLETFKLPNGIKIATYKMPSLKSVHLRISVKGGSLVEDKEKNGVAHFMEHMLVVGIPAYPNGEEFSRYIEGIAGSYGAFTKGLIVTFYITVPFSYLEEALKITAQTFFEPLFVSDAIEKERRAVLEEIRSRMDSHWYKISEFFLMTRFQRNHPLTYDGGGSLKTVEKLTRDDMLSYWKQYFLPKNTYLLISGNFEQKVLQKLLEKYFLQYNAIETFAGFPKMNNSDFSKRTVAIREDTNLKSCYIDFSFPSMSLDWDLLTRIKQNLAIVIFGQLRNSRLFKLLRYQKGLVYDVGAGGAHYPGLGYVYISSQVSPQHVSEVIDLIVKEVHGFVSFGPTKLELDFAKNYLSNQWLMSFDHPSSISGWIEDHLLWEGKVHLPEEYMEMIKKISAEDMKDVINTFWKFDMLNLTIQGPIKHTKAQVDEFTKALSQLQ